MSIVSTGIPFFIDPIKGKPVYNGYIYIGVVDTDPESFPQSIFLQQQDGTIVSAIQPVRTGAGGVPLYNNYPVQILTTGDYSLKIKDAQGNQIYYVPSGLSLTNIGSLSTIRQEFTATEGQQVFSLSNGVTYSIGSNNLSVFVDGCRQSNTLYTELSPSSFRLNDPLSAGQIVLAIVNDTSTALNPLNPLLLSGNFLYNLSLVAQLRAEYTATEGQILFTLPVGKTYTVGANGLAVFIDGCRQSSDAYAETNSTSFTMNDPLSAGQKVLAIVNDVASLLSALATIVTSGPTASRPTILIVGYPYFDTTLGKPIWWNGAVWVLSDGTVA